jgi:hypothetical protein
MTPSQDAPLDHAEVIDYIHNPMSFYVYTGNVCVHACTVLGIKRRASQVLAKALLLNDTPCPKQAIFNIGIQQSMLQHMNL